MVMSFNVIGDNVFKVFLNTIDNQIIINLVILGTILGNVMNRCKTIGFIVLEIFKLFSLNSALHNIN